MTIVAIDGPDNAGKTTLAKHLAIKFGASYHHFGKPASMAAAKQEYFSFIEEHDAKELVILDRSWLGEFVYGPLIRHYQPAYFYEIENTVAQHRVLYIMNYADKATSTMLYKQRKQQDGDDQANFAKHEEILKGFIDIYRKTKSGEKMIFNLANFRNLSHEFNVVTNFVQAWLNHEGPHKNFEKDYSRTMFNDSFRFLNGTMTRPRACDCDYWQAHKSTKYYEKYKTPTWGAGSLDAKYFLVGEAPGHLGCGIHGIPFYGGRSSKLFRDAIFWARVCEPEFYITNAIKCNPKKDHCNYGDVSSCDHNLMRELLYFDVKESFKTVAMGRVAQKVLNNMDVPNTFTYHPSYSLINGTTKEYMSTIKEVFK